MMVGDRVHYVGPGWIGKALQGLYPEGARVTQIEGGCPIVLWPSGAMMIVGEPDSLEVVETLEEMFAKG
jgi:hypothetical protein